MEHQKVLDGLWDASASEEGAMTNSGITDALKALLPTAVVDNRREIEKLGADIIKLHTRLQTKRVDCIKHAAIDSFQLTNQIKDVAGSDEKMPARARRLHMRSI